MSALLVADIEESYMSAPVLLNLLNELENSTCDPLKYNLDNFILIYQHA